MAKDKTQRLKPGTPIEDVIARSVVSTALGSLMNECELEELCVECMGAIWQINFDAVSGELVLFRMPDMLKKH